jgi:hypothetical protein
MSFIMQRFLYFIYFFSQHEMNARISSLALEMREAAPKSKEDFIKKLKNTNEYKKYVDYLKFRFNDLISNPEIFQEFVYNFDEIRKRVFKEGITPSKEKTLFNKDPETFVKSWKEYLDKRAEIYYRKMLRIHSLIKK